MSQIRRPSAASNLSTDERFHAGIAHRRAPGNVDPDADPQTVEAQQLRGPGGDAPLVSCGLE